MNDDDDDDDGRDRRGRWKKGFCPNPKGRPRKEAEISDADVSWFKEHVLEVTLNGEKRQLSRHELLLHAMYELAVKGRSVSIARKLFDRFERADEDRAKLRESLRVDREEFLKDYYEKGKFDAARGDEIIRLQDMLNFGRKAKPQRKPRGRPRPAAPMWRPGPKPQSLLDLEKEEAAEARKAARDYARRIGLPVDDEDEDPTDP